MARRTSVIDFGERGVRHIETACFALAGAGEVVLFLGADVRSGRWLLWWGEKEGLGGIWCDDLPEAWGMFLEATA